MASTLLLSSACICVLPLRDSRPIFNFQAKDLHVKNNIDKANTKRHLPLVLSTKTKAENGITDYQ